MPQVKNLLKDTSVQVAQRKRKCHRNEKHLVAAGEACLVVRDPASGSYRNYCTECARPILANARESLETFESMLYSSS
jgi:hypothetical protein